MTDTGNNWKPPVIPEEIICGDMPGDKVKIFDGHIQKANVIFPEVLEMIKGMTDAQESKRTVVAVCGGSGVGKSGVASVLSFYLNEIGIGSYTLSGDNYPRRIPMYNDAERLHIFRESAIKGMLADGEYTEERFDVIHELQKLGEDANPVYTKKYKWFESYLKNGREGLTGYLGTPNEIGFEDLESVLKQFKAGEDKIWLKRMGREDTELWYEEVDFSEINVIIVEWTHGNSDYYEGVDIPILLNSTPAETLAHRKARNRDGAVDSPFTTMVLEIEQELLCQQAHKARIILSKNAEHLSYEEYCSIMGIRE